MTNEQIFKKAIEKAIKNGWNTLDITQFEESDSHYSDVWYFHKGFDYFILEIIFSHEFAKAFFQGKDGMIYEDKLWKQMGNIGWQFQLQIMVLEKEPLKYLEKFL